MSVTAIRNGRAGHGTRQSLLASALTWLWPEPLEHNRRPVGAIWLNSLVGWMWPRPLQREFDGAGVRRAGLPRLMGWAWPNKLDIALTRGWRHSWLWSWIWPGRLMGPDGEICALTPWHPALQPEVCEVTSWRRRIARKGTVAGMMMAAAAVASPTLMEGNNPLDGGRLNAFVSGSGGGSDEQSGTGGGSATGGSGGGGGGGGGSDEGQGGGGVQTPAGPTDLPPPAPDNFMFDSGGQPGDSGLAVQVAVAQHLAMAGVTFLDPPAGDVPGSNEFGGGSGGFGGGSGSGGGGGGSGGGGSGGSGGGSGPGGGSGSFGGSGPGEIPGGGPGGSGPGGPDGDPFVPTGTPNDIPGGGGPGGGGPGGRPGPGGSPGGVPNGGGPIGPFGGPGPEGGGPNGSGAPTGAIPEPATWAMMIMGFGAVGYVIRRRRVTMTVKA